MKNVKSLIFKQIRSDVINSVINSLWRIISGPLTLILIPLFINEVAQGYWYTFISLAALSVFADLGFTTIIAQFSAHEFAHTQFNESGYLIGDKEHINRMGSLFKFTIKWSTSVSVVAFPIIMLVGIIMFASKNEISYWVTPWILYVLTSGLSFVTSSCLSFYEGCNQIAATQKNRLFGAIIQTTSTWLFLLLGFGLYTMSIAAIAGCFVNLIMFILKFKNSIFQLLNIAKNYYYDWRKEFLALLWRYAISFSSGYFIFQIYTPLMFQFHGSVYAGKVGISMSLCSAVFTIANVWVYTSTPQLNINASQKKWTNMDRISFKSILMSSVTFLFGAAVVLFALQFLGDKISIMQRFLSVLPMSMLLASWFLQIIVNGLAVYLRAHKKEPLVWLSLITAFYIAISTTVITIILPAEFLFLGFLSSFVFSLPICIQIFLKKKKEWHISTAS